MTDRAIRNLAHLRRSASTARVLNLLMVQKEHGLEPEWMASPLFHTPVLNRALIIKHRLRRNELDAFRARRQVATKIIIPIDTADLKSGGRYIFVGQRNFDRMMREAFGLETGHPDLNTLALIDALPSLDPFLLREQLRRSGIEPAACYLSISEGDLTRMLQFVESEVRPLVTLSLGGNDGDAASIRRLADKILSNIPGDRMEELQRTLQLRPEEYQEGIFCWKGFLYYKWVLASLADEVTAVADAVRTARPIGRPDRTAREYLDRGRHVLGDRILEVREDAARTLRIYDDAYADLTLDARPGGFRDFLLRAPRLFTSLGEQLGAIQHVVSFWRFRFAPGAPPVGVEELIDVFMDFETGLAGRDEDADPFILAA
ncbi:hypothetical protein N0B44_29145 [Roseibacterium beibuensis]|uniref:hypothetical protein n=1 Tax=[Roseibacterium] beibuensis TaxID=1193142 RepID=UPI00217CDF00|nr:hypothetical protein [Roseibacterium beibuensis]MCS6626991.1 hypothetical protein [Roseibacterium beibuensis]